MVIEHGYLVERYLPDATIEQVADATSRARELAREAGICYLWSAFVPEEGSCFCLFTAPSAEKVCVVNEQAGFPFAHTFSAVLPG